MRGSKEPSPPVFVAAVTFKTTVLMGDLPAALEQVSEYVMAPVVVGVSV